jgi:hypothetical protein
MGMVILSWGLSSKVADTLLAGMHIQVEHQLRGSTTKGHRKSMKICHL